MWLFLIMKWKKSNTILKIYTKLYGHYKPNNDDTENVYYLISPIWISIDFFPLQMSSKEKVST